MYAFFQTSKDGTTWTDLTTPSLIFTNTSTAALTFGSPIPISLYKTDFVPTSDLENSYVRVITRIVPDVLFGTFTNPCTVYFNDYKINNDNPAVNSYLSIYPSLTYDPLQARFNMSMRGNGYNTGLSNGYAVKQKPIIAKPTPQINGVDLFPSNSNFLLLPIVVNKNTPTGNDIPTNTTIVYRPNNMQFLYGSSLSEIQMLTNVSNLVINQRINISVGNIAGGLFFFDIYVNGRVVSSASTNIDPNTTIDQTLTRTLLSVTTGDCIFFTIRWNNIANEGMTLYVLDNYNITIGY